MMLNIVAVAGKFYVEDRQTESILYFKEILSVKDSQEIFFKLNVIFCFNISGKPLLNSSLANLGMILCDSSN